MTPEQELEKMRLENQKMQLKLEIGKSRVRQVCTYVAMFCLCVLFGYGVMWMGDRSVFTAAVGFLAPLITFWFVERIAAKERDAFTQTIDKIVNSKGK